MTNSQDIAKTRTGRRRLQTTANEQNKEAVFDALTAAGITSMTAEFNGEGDSALTAYRRNSRAALPCDTVSILRAAWSEKAPNVLVLSFADAIEVLCYDYLRQVHGRENAGTIGLFEFDAACRTITLEFNGQKMGLEPETGRL